MLLKLKKIDSTALLRKSCAVLFLITTLPLMGQSNKFNLLWWNVENLFDTQHDSLKSDNEFLPDAMRHWNNSRYYRKINDIAQSIIEIGGWSPPAIIGCCEVENEKVMKALTQYSPLRNLNYDYLITESKDIRGIDVALLYQKGEFKVIHHEAIEVKLEHHRPTRDILYVSGLTITMDTLDLFVCHLPSRSGGNYKATEPFRITVAKKIREKVDALFAKRQTPQIIIMGDFNDYPNNRSISEILEAQTPLSQPCRTHLYHLYKGKNRSDKQSFGTYKYQGRWGLLDHIIVSGGLLMRTSRLYTTTQEAIIPHNKRLLQPDLRYGGDKPFRTFYGMKYQGGISDHLPLFVTFHLNYEL